MSPIVQTTGRQHRWPNAETRAQSEADLLILEHGAAENPDLIEQVAVKFLLMFAPQRPPGELDLMVIDNLRKRAAKIRAGRRC